MDHPAFFCARRVRAFVAKGAHRASPPYQDRTNFLADRVMVSRRRFLKKCQFTGLLCMCFRFPYKKIKRRIRNIGLAFTGEPL
jgi:hypothetical protein